MKQKIKQALGAVGDLLAIYIGVQLMLWAGRMTYVEPESISASISATYKSIILFCGGFFTVGWPLCGAISAIINKSMRKDNTQTQQEEHQ